MIKTDIAFLLLGGLTGLGVILGSGKLKSDHDRRLEDEEQIRFIKEWQSRRVKK